MEQGEDRAAMIANLPPLGSTLIVASITLATAVAAVAYARRRARRLNDIWRAFAEEHGFHFDEKAGPWFKRVRPHITGAIDGVTFDLEKHVVSHGHGASVRTRARVTLDRPLDGLFVVCSNRWSVRLNYAFGPPRIETGSSAFDEKILVLGKERQAALEMIDRDVMERLVAFPRRFRIECDDRSATMSWMHGEREPAVLDAAAKLMTALCRTRSATRRAGVAARIR
jgi:hypothetical protein